MADAHLLYRLIVAASVVLLAASAVTASTVYGLVRLSRLRREVRQATARLEADTRARYGLEQTIVELHSDRYRDIVKYLLLHPIAQPERGLAVEAEHPARTLPIVGRGDTWTDAAEDCLLQVQAIEAHGG